MGSGFLRGVPLGEGVAALRQAQGPWFVRLAKKARGKPPPPTPMLVWIL